MKNSNLYVLTLTSAAMLCGTVGAQQRTDNPPRPAAPPSGTTVRSPIAGNLHATKLIGATVKNKAGETIGKIDDLIVSSSANITTAVVSVGGVLGVGDTKVGVPYKSISAAPDGKTVYVDMTEEQLKSMPPYTEASDDQSAAATTHREQNPFTHDTTSSAAQTRTPASAARGENPASAAAPAPSTTAAHVLKASEQPASALIGAEVVDGADSKVGKIKDVIVSNGRGAQAVLAVGGGIGNIGGRMVAVPLDDLTIKRNSANPKHEPDRVQTALSVSQLEALPEFRYE